MNFEYFQIQKRILQTTRSGKVDRKNESRYALSENGIVYYAMTYCFRDTSV